MSFLFFFVFLYPLFMAIFWMIGAMVFFLRRERDEGKPPVLETTPRVAILVPCHNEEVVIRDTIRHLNTNQYPNFEIIAIDDGSSDRTPEILNELRAEVDCLRVVTLTRNYGKAMALRAGALASSAEFLMCIDADALLDRNALFWMIRHFLQGPRVGAVTGNPRVVNRTSLLARIQIGEFSAIIGMVKRGQRDIGRIFTVSGVVTCFRRSAVHEVGYWSPETVTEDIDISWKLQLKHWDIRYEPRALTWILVPETLRHLWRQRLRWAQGGVEAAIKYARHMLHWVSRRMWPVYVEYWVGVAWCYAFAFTVLCWAGTNFLPAGQWPASMAVPTLLPGWTGVILGATCLVQFSVGLIIDSHYERRGLFRHLFWAIWYPAIYWMINAATTVAAVPRGIVHYGETRYAVWRSPGRQLRNLLARFHAGQQAGQRHLFIESPVVEKSRRALEYGLTAVFWGLWAYLVMPLLSLMLWYAGIFLFTDRMITLGGYQAFADQLLQYTAVIFVMGLMLALWMTWNLLHYGRHDRRNVAPRPVTTVQIGDAMHLDTDCVTALQASRAIALHFNDARCPVIDEVIDGPGPAPCATRPG